MKPRTVVETGTFMGISTLSIAEGLKANGFGKVITCEYDPAVWMKAKERFAGSGLAEWIDCRNESSLEIKVPHTIDLLFSDSDPPLREKEVRRFLPQMNPNGLILMHDASSHLKTVRSVRAPHGVVARHPVLTATRSDTWAPSRTSSPRWG